MNPKTDATNLEKKRGRFFLTGLAVASALTLCAFEWRAPVDPFNSLAQTAIQLEVDEEELPPITFTNVEKPKPIFKPKVSTQITTAPVVVTVVTTITTTPDPVSDPDFSNWDDDALFGAEPQFVDDRGDPFVPVENMPEFPGGEAALYKFFGEHMKYPRIAKETGIQGTVYIQFIIDEKGNVTQVATAKGRNVYLDKEAERVVKLLPKWTPGKQRGHAVPVGIRIPVRFTLRN